MMVERFAVSIYSMTPIYIFYYEDDWGRKKSMYILLLELNLID